MLRTLLFSDVPLALSALDRCCTKSLDIQEIACASSITELLAAASKFRPDLILMDFVARLHFTAIRDLHHLSPNSKLVLWTRHIAIEVAYEAIQLGVRGIVPKSVSETEFLNSIHDVGRGHLCLDQKLSTALLTLQPTRLTPRESQMVALLAQGLKNKEIATALDITEGSVKVYLSRLFLKVGVKDRYELALFGLKVAGLAQTRAPQPISASRIDSRPVLLAPLEL